MSDSTHDALTIDDLSVIAGQQTLLENSQLAFPRGKITVLVGGSGAGKSVLLRVIAGLLPRDGDAIRWTGRMGWNHQPMGDPPIRIGIVFQQFALFDELSPIANVQFAIDHRSDRSGPPEHEAADWLQRLGVPTGSPVSVLSGGQKQRLAIARTLAAEPDILLYDEPTSGLDAATGQRVAELIRTTQSQFGRTSIVVTHDYETLIPIADEVLLLDSSARQIHRVPPEDWGHIASKMRAVSLQRGAGETLVAERTSAIGRAMRSIREGLDGFATRTGETLIAAARLPIDAMPIVPRFKWAFRFWLHDLRLVGGPSAWLYLIIAGTIAGFTTTYFTLRFLPFRLYTQPLLIDDLLGSIGFALYRILVPVLATVLIAARCGAAVAADVGVKQYGGQVDALKTLGVRPPAYLLVPILAAFLIATPLLESLAFTASHWVSRFTFALTHPDVGVQFWRQHFFRLLASDNGPWAIAWLTPAKGWQWVVSKNLLCGLGTAVISYHQGISPKQSASDVSHAITATVLWTTLYVLVVHFVVALLEF